jgi:hypothetical protein
VAEGIKRFPFEIHIRAAIDEVVIMKVGELIDSVIPGCAEFSAGIVLAEEHFREGVALLLT